jgi:hypothetical protein
MDVNNIINISKGPFRNRIGMRGGVNNNIYFETVDVFVLSRKYCT